MDGSVYDASLAGVQAPDPGMFPMGARFRIDAANGEGVQLSGNMFYHLFRLQ